MALLSNLRWKINTLIESTIASSNLSVRYASQIILLQVLYYLSASVIFRVTYAVLGWSYSAGVLLNWTDISVENTFGLTLILLWLFNALVSVVIVTLIIGRSKLACVGFCYYHSLFTLCTCLDCQWDTQKYILVVTPDNKLRFYDSFRYIFD